MFLDEILAAQKRGEARGIPSVCSAHPDVIKEALRVFEHPLIESTCNQVNQFGGYTGMTPMDFVRYVRGIADAVNFPFEKIILGGDHLGPSVWQNEPAEVAMQKAEMLVHDFVEAGFTKIHLDCSMRLGGDPEGALKPEMIAMRAARLAKMAGASTPSPVHLGRGAGGEGLRYIIGTEVPIPGGAREREETVRVTKVEDARQTIEVTREAFWRAGLEAAWERVVGVVVQPGVEFGDDFVLPSQPEAARELSKFIESQPMVYEAHSTDYQTREALKNLVRGHFAILKVGPALTFAFREAVFALAHIEDEWIFQNRRSNIIRVLDNVMVKYPEHWKKYYRGTEAEQAFKRKYSLSDRIRYYWNHPEVQKALGRLRQNLADRPIPSALAGQFIPLEKNLLEERGGTCSFDNVISARISRALSDYVEISWLDA